MGFLYFQFVILNNQGDNVSDPVISGVLTQVIAAVSGAIVSIGIPVILSKLNKLNKLYTTVFGLQEVSTVGGLVDNVNDNTDRLDNIEETQEEIMESIKNIEKQLDADHEENL